jgi:hypothetical protein
VHIAPFKTPPDAQAGPRAQPPSAQPQSAEALGAQGK